MQVLRHFTTITHSIDVTIAQLESNLKEYQLKSEDADKSISRKDAEMKEMTTKLEQLEKENESLRKVALERKKRPSTDAEDRSELEKLRNINKVIFSQLEKNSHFFLSLLKLKLCNYEMMSTTFFKRMTN